MERERAFQKQAFSRPKCITAANQITTNSSYNNNNNNQGNSSNGSHSFIRSFVQYQQILHQQYRQQQQPIANKTVCVYLAYSTVVSEVRIQRYRIRRWYSVLLQPTIKIYGHIVHAIYKDGVLVY
uniref:Uncharacterized protein n=1 Tax=Glossina austeni TaxID=7395 RepID=A0A1A9VHJ2_GLOAU